MDGILVITSLVLIYVIGYIISLLILKKYAHLIGVDCYDSPNGNYGDDYASNEDAWIAFSYIWPVFWLVTGLFQLFSYISKVSKRILKK